MANAIPVLICVSALPTFLKSSRRNYFRTARTNNETSGPDFRNGSWNESGIRTCALSIGTDRHPRPTAMPFLYNVESPRVDAAPIPAAKKKAITEVEKDLKALGKRTGQDFRRTLARHANVLRAEVKNLVHQHKDDIMPTSKTRIAKSKIGGFTK